MFEVRGLRSGYGDVEIIHGVDMRIDDGKTFLILALNGAGKTTLLRSMMGLVRQSAGSIMLNGKDITVLQPYERALRGMIFIGEHSIIPTISVKENLEVATHNMKPKDARKSIEESLNLFREIKDLIYRKAGSLSGGQRKFLAFAMAMATRPKILLLDEPSLGLSPVYVKRIIESIRMIKEKGTTIILAEQNASFSQLADEVVFLELGEIKFIGKREDALKNEELASSFFEVGR